MVVAGLLGALLTMNVVRAADRTQPVLVAATDLAPGTVIGDGAVRVAHIHADEAVLSSLVAGKELDECAARSRARRCTRGRWSRAKRFDRPQVVPRLAS
jgi:Flp pilus assembly protein CpaB